MNRDELKSKLINWQKHLDVTVGTLAFGLAVGCFGVSNNFISIGISMLSVYVCFKVIDLGDHYFPQELINLREKEGKTRREIIEQAYSELQLQKINAPIYYVGFISLIASFAYSVFSLIIQGI